MTQVEHMLPHDERVIRFLLQRHHEATAQKNINALQSVFADNGLFVGTDNTEQWLRDAYVKRLADSKDGWDMTECLERHVYGLPGKIDVAGFFEVMKHTELGRMRGAGLVAKQDGDWKIVLYVLSFSVPNKAVNTNFLTLLVRDTRI